MRSPLLHFLATAALAMYVVPASAAAQSEGDTYGFGNQQGRGPARFQVSVGGYIQPQFRARQNSPAPGDEDGFSLRRARVTLSAEQPTESLQFGVEIEGELTPDFSLFDAYASA